MRILRLLTCVALLLFAGATLQSARTLAQTSATTQTNTSAQQSRLVGEVLSANAATGEFSIKTDDGRTVTLKAEERATVQRVPPAEAGKTADAVKITLADVVVGDRLFARGALSADGTTFSARQLVVANKQAVAQTQTAQRDDWQRRGISGRIEAINAERKEITIRARSREGATSVVVDASGKVTIKRYAPDSVRAEDAVQSSFASLRVGDQLRARGERSADGTRFTAEEIVSGSFQRTSGTVESINAAANEVVIKNEQTGQTQTIVVGQKSTLRRIPKEVADSWAQRRVQSGGARGSDGAQSADGARNEERAPREGRGGDGEQRRRPGGGGGRGFGGGRTFQEMLAGVPTITINDLKKGDVVIVNGTGDASRITVITLMTGDAEFIRRLQRLQGRPNRDGQNMSPGLPSDVVGGGTGSREQP